MNISRRSFGHGIAAVTVANAALPWQRMLAATPAKPNSNFSGVQIGIIIAPYNYPELPVPADQLLPHLLQMGLSAVEMQDLRVEAYAGAPGGVRQGYAGSKKAIQGLSAEEAAAAKKKGEDDLRAWRLQAPMDKIQALRKMYDDSGIRIYAFRLANVNHATMTDDEFAYFAKAAHALGANQITTELPSDPAASKRLGDLAAAHDIVMGYHNHLQVNEHSWDEALAQSKGNGINFDVGHYAAAVNGSPIPFIQQHHDRITSIHLKDRKYRSNGGANMPWGQGDTPLRDVLQLLKRERYGFPASIELEYPIPAGSNATAEIQRCLAFAKEALS